ncbi:hypothetical protein [Parapedobacter defluvii]|uniref:hypothetical protein n=1 Tax=Parapedobacter defluvii TaxID=2045106 RepID=UPI00166B4771|nr:hypothetical protein [Parapedobacter defluvii]
MLEVLLHQLSEYGLHLRRGQGFRRPEPFEERRPVVPVADVLRKQLAEAAEVVADHVLVPPHTAGDGGGTQVVEARFPQDFTHGLFQGPHGGFPVPDLVFLPGRGHHCVLISFFLFLFCG